MKKEKENKKEYLATSINLQIMKTCQLLDPGREDL